MTSNWMASTSRRRKKRGAKRTDRLHINFAVYSAKFQAGMRRAASAASRFGDALAKAVKSSREDS